MFIRKSFIKTRINSKNIVSKEIDIKKVYILLGILIAAIFVCFCIYAEIKNRIVWRAVFLTNNQVYFGKLSYRPFFSAAKLTNVYYLQVSEQLQPQDGSASQQEIKIIKFGNELHRPKDMMMIPKSQILFWEELRKDSPIVEKIESKK